MGFEQIMQLITTVAFPIVACLGMGWYVVRISEQHKTETDQFTKALQENTVVLQKLVDKLDAMDSNH